MTTAPKIIKSPKNPKTPKIPKPPKLPELLQRKIYKTGQTRGADDDEIYQNRVSRTSTVLIPYAFFKRWSLPIGEKYENNSIVLISPDTYFKDPDIEKTLSADGLVLGVNTLVFYETKAQWDAQNPNEEEWTPATRRKAPDNETLGGQYVARISATTATKENEKINRGFINTKSKGAGIRVYEYASKKNIAECRLQLEALFWKCYDSHEVAILNEMTEEDIRERKDYIAAECEKYKLLDLKRIIATRILNNAEETICPLCLERLSAKGFFSRMAQAEGRLVLDLTNTQLNLFHIEELRLGEWNHRPYNLGWGHHHCNVVVKDSGITKTLEWMQKVVADNVAEGHLQEPTNSNNAP